MEGKSFIKRLIIYFLEGVIYIFPIVFTLFIIFWVINFIDSYIGNLLPEKTNIILKYSSIPIMIIIIIITGFIGGKFVSTPIIIKAKNILHKIPIFGPVYSSIKDIISAFIGNKKKFNRPVMIRLYENSNIKIIGFITDDNLTIIKNKNAKNKTQNIAVYIPHSYAISGQLFIVPIDYIFIIDSKNPVDVMKYIVSGGISKSYKKINI